MAETFSTKPGELDIEITHGEPWSMSFTVNKNLTGFTHYAAVVLANGTEVEISTSATPGATSTVGLSLSDAQVTALDLGVRRWYYRWTDPVNGERTILRGDAKVLSNK